MSSEGEQSFTIVEDSNQLINALTSESIVNVRLSDSITLSQIVTIRNNKVLDLDGHQLTLNGTSELRFSGNLIESFVLKNGNINGTATTFIGDGNNANPTAATNQLSSLNVYLENIEANGNNFYNALTTNIFLTGNININVRNTGFRVKNFTARSGSNIYIKSSGGTPSGTTAQSNNTMQGVTMGNYATTGSLKEFLVEKDAKVSIEVDQGGQYNNGIADFTHLEVYGELSVDTWGTSLRSTPSFALVPYVYANFHPESTAYIRTRSNVQTGVFFTYPAIVNVDSPEKFDMIYYGNNRFFWPWQGGSISGSGLRNSTISFRNMDIAVWNNTSMGMGAPALLDSNVTFLDITNLNSTNTGTVSTDSIVFQNFNPNNYSRISNDVNMPTPNPSLSVIEPGKYALLNTATNIKGVAKYMNIENSILDNTFVPNADLSFHISGIQYLTETDELGNWELSIDISNLPIGTTGQLMITDQSLRTTTVEIVIQEDFSVPVPPVDPIAPENEIDPDNAPELPDNQGPLSIDFVSSFLFGTQKISTNSQTFYAQPQRILNEDGSINYLDKRPNFVQISDRRPANERGGWQLSVTQDHQFKNSETNNELIGASVTLSNQELVTAQEGNEPTLKVTQPVQLVPEIKRTLLAANGDEGTGTWIYRFGNLDTAETSISLDIPKGANPEATSYQTKFVWELSSIPSNE